MNFVLGGHGGHDFLRDLKGASSKLQSHEPVFSETQKLIPQD